MEVLSENKFEKIKDEILETLKRSPIETEPIHAQAVLKWILILKPDADEALQIAALSHDIERGITGIMEKDLQDYSQIDNFKKEHALRSAKIISEIMRKHGYQEEIITKVEILVKNHEVGGDDEANILRDADSIAYFEYNIPSYFKRNSRDRTKEKIKFMYKRIPENIKKIIDNLTYSDSDVKTIVNEAIYEIKNK
jgi:hypothetical protein